MRIILLIIVAYQFVLGWFLFPPKHVFTPKYAVIHAEPIDRSIVSFSDLFCFNELTEIEENDKTNGDFFAPTVENFYPKSLIDFKKELFLSIKFFIPSPFYTTYSPPPLYILLLKLII